MNSPYGLPAECIACHLHPGDFFCALSPETLLAFDQIKHTTVFPKGAIIFLEGQSQRGVFMLCQGEAKLTASARDGKTFILRIAKPGEILGLEAAFTDEPYALSAETMQPSQLAHVSQEDFLRLLREHDDARLRAAQHISRNCLEAYEVIRTIGLSHSVFWRIAKFLLTSATDGQLTDGVVRAKFTLTHEEMAQTLGTSRETITRTLTRLRKKNIVELKGSTLIIRDKSALERFVMPPS